MITLALLVVSFLPTNPAVAEDRCDVIEVNHYYDNQGDLVFTQLIFWRFDESESEYRVIAWRMLKSKQQNPLRDVTRGCVTTIFDDEGVLRRVRAESVRETRTQYDPELLDRQHVSPEQRRGLSRIKRKE